MSERKNTDRSIRLAVSPDVVVGALGFICCHPRSLSLVVPQITIKINATSESNRRSKVKLAMPQVQH